jgi:hypothetical protein
MAMMSPGPILFVITAFPPAWRRIAVLMPARKDMRGKKKPKVFTSSIVASR